MPTHIWEVRFLDGRGASFFTSEDITAEIGTTGTRVLRVAASVFDETALADAGRSIRAGLTLELVANMATVAYAVRHELAESTG